MHYSPLCHNKLFYCLDTSTYIAERVQCSSSVIEKKWTQHVHRPFLKQCESPDTVLLFGFTVDATTCTTTQRPLSSKPRLRPCRKVIWLFRCVYPPDSQRTATVWKDHKKFVETEFIFLLNIASSTPRPPVQIGLSTTQVFPAPRSESLRTFTKMLCVTSICCSSTKVSSWPNSTCSHKALLVFNHNVQQVFHGTSLAPAPTSTSLTKHRTIWEVFSIL